MVGCEYPCLINTTKIYRETDPGFCFPHIWNTSLGSKSDGKHPLLTTTHNSWCLFLSLRNKTSDVNSELSCSWSLAEHHAPPSAARHPQIPVERFHLQESVHDSGHTCTTPREDCAFSRFFWGALLRLTIQVLRGHLYVGISWYFYANLRFFRCNSSAS